MRTFFFIALFLIPCVFGAQITGTAYTETLQPAQYATLTINTTPQQRIILTDGTYNISVPTGSYLLRVAYKSGQRQYEDEVIATVIDEGAYVYDLILFRTSSNTTEAELPDLEDLSVPDEPAPKESTAPLRTSLLILLLLGLAVGAIFLSKKQWWKIEKRRERKDMTQKGFTDSHSQGNAEGVVNSDDKKSSPVSPDLKKILDVLRQEGGRATQKELRRNIPCSEAKMSMMLADLESQGKIRRIRQGRANIIILN